MAAVFLKDSCWQYKCPFRKTWVDVSKEEDRQLKEAYRSLPKGGYPVAVCNVGTTKFSTDFQTMIRTNVASKRCMEVRLRDGPLPFKLQDSAEEAPASSSLDGDGLGIAPCDLEMDGKKVPHSVRKAWGQGIEDGITMSGQFEFTLEASEKECFGEMLSWNILAAGILPQNLDNRCLKFTSAQGDESMGSKKEIAKMLANPRAYPIHISYKPHPAFLFMPREQVQHIEVQRTFLKMVKEAVAELDGNLDNVKHKHQRRTFERYLLYLEDHYSQTGDDLSDALDMETCETLSRESLRLSVDQQDGPGSSKDPSWRD